jgi:hypothetical protein
VLIGSRIVLRDISTKSIVTPPDRRSGPPPPHSYQLVGFNRLCDPKAKLEKGAVKLVVLNGENFGYSKNRTHNYLLSQGCAIWEIIHEEYMIPTMLDNATQGEVQRYGNNYKSLNLITTVLDMNVYDRVSHL